MIITSHIKLNAGQIYNQDDCKTTFEYLGDIHREYTFLVIRETTVEEYRNDIKEHENLDLIFDEYEYFYEVSMD
jgi:hypothetical protein